MSDDTGRIISQTAAVVVTYNPDVDALAAFVDGLVNEFAEVIVVDNSDDAAIRARVGRIIDARSQVVSMAGNAGVGAAQNRGIDIALRGRARFVVTFDQDSAIDSGYLRSLADAFVEASKTHDVAAIGPRAVDAETGQDYAPAGERPAVVATTLSSGLLISREAWQRVGPMDETLFIDLVDWDWCFRARAKGLVVMIDPNTVLRHKLGERHTRIRGIGRIGTPEPWRHYYALRNYIELCRRDHVPVAWKLEYFFINVFKFLTYPVFMERGGERLHHMLAGIEDGLAGKSGVRVTR